MEDSANLAVIVGIYVTLIGTAWAPSSTPFDRRPTGSRSSWS